MILALITFIFCALGIYGFYTDNLILLYIGLAAAILEHVIGITSGQENPGMIWITIMFIIGMIIGGFNWLQSIAICFCYENVILTIAGIIFMIYTYKKAKSFPHIETEEERKEREKQELINMLVNGSENK